MAEDLRVPVSNLVRNVLEEAFSVVEAVTDNVGDLIDEVAEEAERARHRIRDRRRARPRAARPEAEAEADAGADAAGARERAEFPEVIGWQPLIFNQLRHCGDCEEPIERGERGFAGLTEGGLAGVYLCADCTDTRQE